MQRSRIAKRDIVYSCVHLLVWVLVCQLLKRLRYNHEIFMGARNGQNLRQVRELYLPQHCKNKLETGCIRCTIYAGGDSSFNVSGVLVVFDCVSCNVAMLVHLLKYEVCYCSNTTGTRFCVITCSALSLVLNCTSAFL